MKKLNDPFEVAKEIAKRMNNKRSNMTETLENEVGKLHAQLEMTENLYGIEKNTEGIKKALIDLNMHIETSNAIMGRILEKLESA